MIELTGRLTMTADQIMEFGRLTEAASRGDGDAACRLGDMYREAKGGLRYSPKLAFHWYSRSALAGDAHGRSNLGACFEHGLGCQQSYRSAVKWYRLAAAQRNGTASMNLAYCYMHGHGVPADQGAALRLFRVAVEQGEDRAEREVERLEGPARRPRVQIVDRSEPGRHFGLVGGGGVTPPNAGVPAEDRNRGGLLDVPTNENAGSEPRGSGTAEPLEGELFPIFADGGLKPEDLVEGTAERYAAYLAQNHPSGSDHA